MLNVIVIGLGKQSCEDHLPAIEESPKFRLVGVIDTNATKLKEISDKYSVPGFLNIKDSLKSITNKPDVAIAAVPHNAYLPIINELARNKIHVIKEKPFATNFTEAAKLRDLAQKNNIKIFVTLQRRFNPIFNTFNQLVKHTGSIYSIEARYTMNVERLDEGWRAKKKIAGGGALVDMGYHFVDLIIWYFGLPDTITCKLSQNNRSDQMYDVEDTAFINFTYNERGGDEQRILGNMIVSRTYESKEESITVYGTKGSIHVKRGRICRKDKNGNEIEVLERKGAWPSAIIDQLEYFADQIMEGKKNATIVNSEYLEHIAFIEAAYLSNINSEPKSPKEFMSKL